MGGNDKKGPRTKGNVKVLPPYFYLTADSKGLFFYVIFAGVKLW